MNNTFSNITLFSIPLISLAWAVWWLFGTEPNWLVGFATLLRQRLHLVAELNYGLCTMSFIYQETVHKTNSIVYLNNVAAVQHTLFRDIDGMFWWRSVSRYHGVQGVTATSNIHKCCCSILPIYMVLPVNGLVGLTLTPTWISNYIHYKVWGEITYPCPNFIHCPVWRWIRNFLSHLTGRVIPHPTQD